MARYKVYKGSNWKNTKEFMWETLPKIFVSSKDISYVYRLKCKAQYPLFWPVFEHSYIDIEIHVYFEVDNESQIISFTINNYNSYLSVFVQFLS